VQEWPESVVVEASVAVADAADLLNQEVDGFGGSVAGSFGVEVCEEFLAPHGECAAEAGDFGHWAVQEVVDEFGGMRAACGQVGLGEGLQGDR
jgi:hypothetical protein